ncbi:hypothetical protein OZN62_01005 [Aurantiacibacter sp. MUD11]|uniref:hypothetical protein n=1 Tax=Aurantiacibacter sp. MUD11 TaxID=3003265 RepID=UPI0022AA2824|nr:hypothetical protein [Aurantiacibacter sp. MUD11]WAT18188.1 hypothetical protein OZN62_01005 [Aurantiacibacter sp. MUD11]
MNKGLALTLALAVVFLVTAVAEEGGPLDNFTNGDGAAVADDGTQLAQADEDSVVLAANVRPTPEPTEAPEVADDEGSMWDWFAEEDAAPAPPPPPAPARPAVTRGGGSEVTGELSRHRMNIED